MAAIKTQTVPALDRALTLLELLADSRAGLTLPEMVIRSGLPKSSVHYLLVTLERRGYLGRSERTGRYLFASGLFNLANKAIDGSLLRQTAAPHLQNLSLRTNLTAHMAVLERHEAVLIAKHDAMATPRVATWVGKRMELHCTGLGKALLASMAEPHIDRLLSEQGLSRHNENTLATPVRLKEDLARAQQLGYAVEDEEDELGFRCIAAAVRSPAEQAVAAVSVCGSTQHIAPGQFQELGRHVRTTADRIAQSLLAACVTPRIAPQPSVR